MKNAKTPRQLRPWLLAAVVGVASMAAGGQARAQCCPGYAPATACAGMTLTKSRWCVQSTVPTGQGALTPEFCAYGDKVITTLESVFNIPANGAFEFELDTQTGGAHTGTACDHVGNGVAFDAFKGSAYEATGFWGYLLALHEAINVWTGMASTGWPTDWWADHQSAFPNLMDFHVMNTIGVANNDQNLINAAAAQKARFYPRGDSADPKVVALDNVFAAMPRGDGFAGFSHMFALQSADGVQWDRLGVANPDVKRSEYVAAYMSLAAGQNVLSLLQGPGQNGGGGICSGKPDGTQGDQPYTCSAGRINAIASAHCAVAANGKRMADLASLRAGNAATVPSGPCGSACPGECGCDTANHCVARWLTAAGSSDAGPAEPDAGVSVDTGATGGTGAGGAGGRGAGGAGGSAGTTGGAGGAGTDAGPSGNGNASTASGCNCQVSDARGSSTSGALLIAGALATLWRRRRTRG